MNMQGSFFYYYCTYFPFPICKGHWWGHELHLLNHVSVLSVVQSHQQQAPVHNIKQRILKILLFEVKVKQEFTLKTKSNNIMYKIVRKLIKQLWDGTFHKCTHILPVLPCTRTLCSVPVFLWQLEYACATSLHQRYKQTSKLVLSN